MKSARLNTVALTWLQGGHQAAPQYRNTGFFSARALAKAASTWAGVAALRALVLPQGPVVPRECTYFLGRETVLPRRGGNSGMAWWRERLFAVLCRNARNATYFFGLPVERVFEVGNMVEI